MASVMGFNCYYLYSNIRTLFVTWRLENLVSPLHRLGNRNLLIWVLTYLEPNRISTPIKANREGDFGALGNPSFHQRALHQLRIKQRHTHLRVNAHQVAAPPAVDQNFWQIQNGGFHIHRH